MARSRVGRRFFDAATHAAEAGMIPERTAARYLGVKSHESFENLIRATRVVG